MDSLTQFLTTNTDRLHHLISSHKLTALGLATAPILLRQIYLDYCDWYALGAGGIPHNPFGYLVGSILSLRKSRDIKGTLCYKKLLDDPVEGKSYFDGDLPIREGATPLVSTWIAPIRQLNGQAGRELVLALDANMRKIATSNSSHLDILPSKFEGGSSDAVWSNIPAPSTTTDASSPSAPAKAKKEIYHVHHSDGSAHTVLSAADARLIIDRGWGERHWLSGQVLLPLGYTMVYAPRNEEELRVHQMVVKAAAGYALQGEHRIL